MYEAFAYPRNNPSHIERKWFDLPYADQSQAQKLDIYLPDHGSGPFPVIVTIHGGGWMSGDKGDVLDWPFSEALKREYAVIGINYRLSNEAYFPSQIYDCKAAVCYIRTISKKYHLDNKHIGAWGSSAGGYLAALLGTSAKAKGLEDASIRNSNYRTYPNLQAVVVWYAPIESFLTMDEELTRRGLGSSNHSGSDSAESKLLGRRITDVPALVKFASPMTYIDMDIPPFLIQHGLLDEIVPVEQAIRFTSEVEKIAGSDKVTLEILNEAKHSDPLFETPQNIERVLDFFDKHLKGNS